MHGNGVGAAGAANHHRHGWQSSLSPSPSPYSAPPPSSPSLQERQERAAQLDTLANHIRAQIAGAQRRKET
jgi:hypothetical protein